MHRVVLALGNSRISSVLRFLFGPDSVGFLTIYETDNSGYLGSFLITDLKSIPLEFRCTHSIKPDNVQKSLYGEHFLPHIGVELCGKPLIRSARKKPRLIFVNKPFLVNLDNQLYPVVFVRELNEDKTSIMFEFGQEYHSEVIEPPDDTFKSLEIVKKNELTSENKELVEQLYSEFNILEPFERMNRAVDNLVRRSSRFK